MKKTLLYTLGACTILAGTSQAALVSFTNLTTGLLVGTNGLTTGGFTTADAELTVTGAASGNDFVYSVSYTGQSYDGDAINDTLSFQVLVQGWTGSDASTNFLGSEANVNATHGTVTTIGTTDAAVDITGARWSVGNSVMSVGETLEFSLQNFAVVTSSGAYSASLNSFTGTSYQETGKGFGHVAVIGDVGTDRFDTRWNQTNYNITGLLNETDQLYITSADLESDAEGGTIPSSNPQRWGVSSSDFGVNVDLIPEPSSVALVGLAGTALLMRRRR